MTSLILVDSKNLMAQHPAALREYAKRVFVHGEDLAPAEENDKDHRMEEFLAAGRSFRLTDREMVSIIYRGLLR